MPPLDLTSPLLDEAHLPRGLTIKRNGLSFEVSQAGRWSTRDAAMRVALSLATMAVVAVVAGLTTSTCSTTTSSIWLGGFLPAMFPLFSRTSGMGWKVRVSAIGWVWRTGWRWRAGLDTQTRLSGRAAMAWVRGVEVEPVFSKHLYEEPTWRISLRYRPPEEPEDRVSPLIEQLPSEAIAGSVVQEFARVYRETGTPGELQVLEAPLPGVRLQSEPERLVVEWNDGADSMQVTDAGITVRRAGPGQVDLDADELAEVSLVPSPRRGNSDLVAQLMKGGFTILIGVKDPPGLAARVVDDVRRVLRLA